MVVINCSVKELRKNGYESLQKWLDESPDNIYIGRGERMSGANKSKWSNPYPVAQYGRDEVLRLYRQRVLTTPQLFKSLPELKGKNLACWCAPLDCHGHILEELSNMSAKKLEEQQKIALQNMKDGSAKVKSTKIEEPPKVEESDENINNTQPAIKVTAPKGKGNLWEKKLQQIAKNKKLKDIQQEKQQEEFEVKEEVKKVNKEKREREKKEKEKAKIKAKEVVQKLSDPEKSEYNKIILDQIQPSPLPSTKRIDEISDKLYHEIIRVLPDTECDGKALKYSHAMTKMILYGVTYPTPIMNEIDAIWRSIKT